MTVEIQNKKVTANGNGVTTVFSFSPLVIFESTDIVVTKRTSAGVESTLAEGSSSTTYSVSVSSYPGTGSITYPAVGGTPLASGESVTIKRVLTLEQTLDLENQGGYFPDLQETAFDKLLMVCLQQQEELDRCLKIEVSDTTTTLADLEANLADVAAIDSNIVTVAGISANVTTVAGISANVTTVAGVSASVTTVAGISANVTTVAGISANVTTVAGISANVTTVAGISANVTTVAGISANVTTVAGISANVTTVAGISADVTTVAGVSTDVSAAVLGNFKFTFDTSTSMADPGTGDFRLNHATIASATAIAFSNASADTGNPDISDWLATWGASTTTGIKGTLTLRKVGSASTFAIFSITAAITDNGAWLQATASYVAGSGTFSAADKIQTIFSRTGSGSGDVLAANNGSDFSSTQTTFNTLAAFDGTPNTDLTANGPNTNTFAAAGTITALDLVYLNGSSQWAATDADAAATAGPVQLAISLESKTVGQAMKVALPGSFVRNDAWNWTPGAILYVSETAGAMSASVPTGVDGIVRIVGHAVTADVIWFEPDDAWVTIDASGTLKNVSGIAPAAVTSGFTLGTPQATTSGSSKTFSSIPAGTKKIVVTFAGVSTNGTAELVVQLGDGGGLETSGYVGSVGSGAGAVAMSAGFAIVSPATAARTFSGSLTLTLENSAAFTWAAQGILGTDTAAVVPMVSAGHKSLSAELTQLALVTTNTLDAGEVNIAYM